MILFKLLLWLLPIGANIYLDRNGAKRNYILVFIVRGWCAILHGLLFKPHNMMDYGPVLIFQLTSYWILFELGLNLVRKNHFLYYDHKEGDSGIIDRFFKWAGWEMHLIAKLCALFLLVFSIIVIYTR